MGRKDQPVRICPSCNRSGMRYVKKMRKLPNGKTITEETVEVCKQCGGNGTI